MTHYTPQDWLNFKQDHLSEASRQEMEEHLQACTRCMDLFLDLVTEDDMKEAAQLVPPDFSRNTMRFIKAQASATIPSSRNKRRKLLAYYTAAAVITLMLVSGGVFQNIAAGLAGAAPAQDAVVKEGPVQLLYSWPAQLQKTSNEYVHRLNFHPILKEVKW